MRKVPTTKPFQMPMPKDTRVVVYNKVMVHFVDHTGASLEHKRLCSYVDDKLDAFVTELKRAYKEVTMLPKENKIPQVQCKVEEGDTVDESFQTVYASPGFEKRKR